MAIAIARHKGFNGATVRAMPSELLTRGLTGLTLAEGSQVTIFYDPTLSPLNQTQTIMHECAHVLHGDIRPDDTRQYHRTTFEDPQERRAEITGMNLMAEFQRRQREASLLDFISGQD